MARFNKRWIKLKWLYTDRNNQKSRLNRLNSADTRELCEIQNGPEWKLSYSEWTRFKNGRRWCWYLYRETEYRLQGGPPGDGSLPQRTEKTSELKKTRFGLIKIKRKNVDLIC